MTSVPGSFVALDDPEFARSLDHDMERVEVALHAAVQHVDEYIGAASVHLLQAGGKRLRPLLTLLAGQLGPAAPAAASEEVIKAAVVVELTHLASLYHDDVMDESALRRGVPSANARYGNTVAILTGDLLFARASRVVADLGADAVRIQASTFERLCAGQIQETVGPASGLDPVEHYLSVLADKTGSLIATAGLFGARFAGCDEGTVEVMRCYGERLGVAFQLADDLIDLASPSEASGKVPGTDLREGVPTLPVLLVRRAGDPADAQLLELLAGSLGDDARLAAALDLLRRHPALDQARLETQRWADQAREALAPLPPSPVKAALEDLAAAVVQRDA